MTAPQMATVQAQTTALDPRTLEPRWRSYVKGPGMVAHTCPHAHATEGTAMACGIAYARRQGWGISTTEELER